MGIRRLGKRILLCLLALSAALCGATFGQTYYGAPYRVQGDTSGRSYPTIDQAAFEGYKTKYSGVTWSNNVFGGPYESADAAADEATITNGCQGCSRGRFIWTYQPGYFGNGDYGYLVEKLGGCCARPPDELRGHVKVYPNPSMTEDPYEKCKGVSITYADPATSAAVVAVVTSACFPARQIVATQYSYRPERDLGSSCQVGQPSLMCGNPINAGSGNKFQVETDIEGDGFLQFVRYYNSAPAAQTHLVGRNWTNSFTRRIEFRPGTGSTPTVALVSRPNGSGFKFTLNGSTWIGDPDVYSKLVATSDASGAITGWRFTEQDARQVEVFDAIGRLTSIEQLDGTFLSFTYNGGNPISGTPDDHLLTSVTAQNGRGLSLSYYPNRLLHFVADAAGNQYEYFYDFQERLTSVKYPDGSVRAYRYNETSYTSGANLPYALTGIIDEANKRFATFSYFTDGRARSTEHAGGVEKFEVAYNANGTSTTTKPGGATQTQTLTTPMGLIRATVVSVAGNGTERQSVYTYDAMGRPDQATDARGILADYDFDSQGRLGQIVEAANNPAYARTTIRSWHPSFRLATEEKMVANGQAATRTLTTYNDRGQVTAVCVIDVKEADPLWNSCGIDLGTAPPLRWVKQTRYVYCEQADVSAGTCPRVGLLISVDGPRSDVFDITRYTYYPTDASGCPACTHRKADLWKVTNALGRINEILAYDGAGRPTSIRDANGISTDLEYHARGWLTARKVRGENKASEVDDAITTIEYWPTGLIKKVTLPDGSFTSYAYDDAHRLTDVVDNFGNKVHYGLDNLGNRTLEETRNPSGNVLRTLSRVYDQLGELRTTTDAYQHSATLTHDAAGNIDTITDALGHLADDDYDPLNRLAQSIQDVGGVGATTQLQYDASDNLSKVIDPKGLSTNYEYDGFGNLTKLTSPDTGVTTYTYDPAGNRKTQVDARGVTTTYTYDVLGRMTAIEYSDGTPGVRFTYDYPTSGTSAARIACAAMQATDFRMGRLSRIDDASGSSQYCYDRFGNVAAKRNIINDKVFTTRYSFTTAGRLSTLTYPSGAKATYTHNALGEVSAITWTPSGGTAVTLLANVVYYPFGPASELTYGTGRRLTRTLNQNYQPGIIEDLGLGGLSVGYEFDAVGNLSKLRNGSQSEPPLLRYVHDPLGRLTEVREGASDTLLQGYGYDATGNRTSLTEGGITTAYAYLASSHRLLSVGPDVVRSYDNAGNTTSIGGTARGFVYDGGNRMTQVTQNGSVTMNYTYNGNGEQVRRFPTVGSQPQYLVYDEAGHLLGTYDANGARVQEFIWLDDLLVGVIANGALQYVEPDYLGTPRVVIDPGREVAVWSWPLTSESFGNSQPNQDPDANGESFVFDLRFPGQRYDAASGLSYNYFRDYEAITGRYVESDPWGLKGGISTYSYAEQTPLEVIDPSGLAWQQRSGNFSPGAGGNSTQRRAATRKWLREHVRDDELVYRSRVDPEDSMSPYSPEALTPYEGYCRQVGGLIDLCGPGPRFGSRCIAWECRLSNCTWENPSGTNRGPFIGSRSYSVAKDPNCRCIVREYFDKW